MRRLWLYLLGVAAACSIFPAASGFLPPSAGAAATVGADLNQTPSGNCGAAAGEPCSLYTVTKGTSAPEGGSPITGVLVSARIRTQGAANTVAVRVLRLNPMMAATYLNIGPETLIPVTADATMAGHVTEAVNLHHPINAGEKLGIGYVDTAANFVPTAATLNSTCGFRQGAGSEHPVDTERTYTEAGCIQEVLVQGTVEPDVDRDNFGDETQDLCPTNAAVQGTCPVTPVALVTPAQPAPPKKQKCKKKKKKSKNRAAAAKKCKKGKKRKKRAAA